MPFQSNRDLPPTLQNLLSERAQNLYRESFNNALEKYRDPNKWYRGNTHEETAHRVAWMAVKEKYEKFGDRWVEKEILND